MAIYIELEVSSYIHPLKHIAAKLDCEVRAINVGDEFELKDRIIRTKKVSFLKIKTASFCESPEIQRHCHELLNVIQPISENLESFVMNDEYRTVMSFISEGPLDPEYGLEMRADSESMEKLLNFCNEFRIYADK